MIRLYHPDIDPNGYDVEAADDDQAAIYEASGWERAPEPPAAREGYAAERLAYEQDDEGKWRPVLPEAPAEPEPEPTKVRRTNKASEDS